MLPMFKCIAADPPWKCEQGGGKIQRGAQRHYPLLSNTDILRTMLDTPLWQPDPSGCHLWLWATRAALLDALWLMDALRFKYVTNWVWVKDRLGLGQYSRSRHEHLLFGRLLGGKIPVPATDCRPDSVLEVAASVHSRKPGRAYKNIIEVVSPGPRLEMFGREARAGWTVTGNEIAGGTVVSYEADRSLVTKYPLSPEEK